MASFSPAFGLFSTTFPKEISVLYLLRIQQKLLFIARVLVALICLGVSLILGQTPGNGEPVRIDTELVSIPVSVLDRDGRYVVGLEAKNFKVYEAGVEQEIGFFGSNDQPLTVVLLLDRSWSMTKHLQALAQAASVFVRQLRPGDDIMIATFADDVDEVVPLMRVSQIPKSIAIRQHGSATLVYDAVDFGLKKLRTVRGRKAIVLFSDGLSENGRSSAKESLRDAEESEAAIFTIRFGEVPTKRADWRGNEPQVDPWNPSLDESTRTHEIVSRRDLDRMGNGEMSPKEIAKLEQKVAGYMTGLASRTGGRSFHIRDIQDLEATFGAISAELTRQYSLGYYPKRPGKDRERRPIKVEVDVPNAIVRSRREVVFKKGN